MYLLTACDEPPDMSKMEPYKGPMMETENMETLYSDSAKIRVRMTAPKRLEMENGDQFFPKGVYIEFYKNELRSTTLQANSGTYNKKKNLYTVTGNVIVTDSLEGKKLNTEILNWDPIRKKIFTEKFVTIQTPKEILKGEGMDAHQDFSSYRFRKPTGVFAVPQ